MTRLLLLQVLLVFTGGCSGLRPRAEVEQGSLHLTWPAALVPGGATEVTYEVCVWGLEREVPTEVVFQRSGLRQLHCVVDRAALPKECRWSVRAHWRQDGRARQSRWLGKNGVGVSAAALPCRCLPGL